MLKLTMPLCVCSSLGTCSFTSCWAATDNIAADCMTGTLATLSRSNALTSLTSVDALASLSTLSTLNTLDADVLRWWDSIMD